MSGIERIQELRKVYRLLHEARINNQFEIHPDDTELQKQMQTLGDSLHNLTLKQIIQAIDSLKSKQYSPEFVLEANRYIRGLVNGTLTWNKFLSHPISLALAKLDIF